MCKGNRGEYFLLKLETRGSESVTHYKDYVRRSCIYTITEVSSDVVLICSSGLFIVLSLPDDVVIRSLIHKTCFNKQLSISFRGLINQICGDPLLKSLNLLQQAAFHFIPFMNKIFPVGSVFFLFDKGVTLFNRL